MTPPPDAQTPTPLTERLRSWARGKSQQSPAWECHEAADEIERLQRELTAERERGRRVREETIEKCAKIAEELKITTEWCEGSPRTYRMAMPVETAEAIRALSRAESAPE